MDLAICILAFVIAVGSMNVAGAIKELAKEIRHAKNKK